LKKRQRTDDNSLLTGCRSIDDNFEHLNKIDEGSYGVVYRAKDKTTGEIVAIKRVKLAQEKEGFPITALRELNTLLSLEHENVIRLNEVVHGSSLNKVYMVMEYCDHEVKSILEDKSMQFSHSQIKCLVKQLLQGVEYMHRNYVFHRDLKTSNLLYQNEGGILKICDFGLARRYSEPVTNYTGLVCTLWYRAPELLLGFKQYSKEVDMWSVGCIFAELILKTPLFMGTNELDQLDKIFKILGNPNDQNWPGWKTARYS